MLVSVVEDITSVLGGFVFFNIFSPFGVNLYFPLVFFILIVGYIISSFQMRFIQFRRFKECLKYTFGKKEGSEKKQKGEVSSLKILFTSVASCTGMNSIAGMVFMVCIGGPGTIFWIPILAFGCLSLRFMEVYLSHFYRSARKEEMLGGPFDYIKKGLTEMKFAKLGKTLAYVYALIMLIGGLTGVAMYESNQFVATLTGSFAILSGKRIIVSVVAVAFLAYVIFGGTKRITNVIGTILPVIAIVYFFASLVVIIANYSKLGQAFVIIFEDAMHPKSIAGGFLASLCLCARKICLVHETGLGTAGIVHASSKEKDSIREATSSMLTPLISCFICSLTAIVLVITGFYSKDHVNNGVMVVFDAFGSVSSILPYIITILAPLLAFNVLIGWGNYVLKCAKYCFSNDKIIFVLVIFFLCSAFAGGIIDNFVLIMNFVDSLVTSIIFINMPVVLLLGGKVRKAVKDYKF